MNYIKSINEYSNTELYHKVSEEEFFERIDSEAISISDNTFNNIKAYVDRYVEYHGAFILSARHISRIRVITDYHYIYIYQLPDEYFGFNIGSIYYICDEIIGVLKLLEYYRSYESY